MLGWVCKGVWVSVRVGLCARCRSVPLEIGAENIKICIIVTFRFNEKTVM